MSDRGQRQVEQFAAEAAVRGARPDIVWHSGKLRARQTAETFWRECNPSARFAATRDLQPADPPSWIRDRLRGETRDLLIAGHLPHLTGLLKLLLARIDDDADSFPLHGVVALESEDGGATWSEMWRIENG